MKRLLLGALLVLGTVSYAQNNRVIKPIGKNGATAVLPIVVTGQVFNKSDKSLVVDVLSAPSPEGTGFAFKTQNLFASGEKELLEGRFKVQIVKDGRALPLAGEGTLATKLVQGTTENESEISVNNVSGQANDTKLKYALSVTKGTTENNGRVAVEITPGAQTGTFTDGSVSLKVELSK